MPPRVAPPRVFPVATRAGKPPMDAAGSADAYRQTSFVLGTDLDLVLQGMNLEGAAARASSGSKFRTQATAATLASWSRSWLCRLEALHAVEWGNYTAALPLIRSAVDHAGAEQFLLQQDAAEWTDWLDEGGVGLAPSQHATEFRLHRFRAAESLAVDPVLAPIYRASMDLSLPHFGATLLLAGGDSDAQRTAITFGDRDFHVAFAELALGWLCEVSAWHLETARAHPEVLPLDDAGAVDTFVAATRALCAAPGRCHVEIAEVDGLERYLVHNLRRAPGAAPKRMLL